MADEHAQQPKGAESPANGETAPVKQAPQPDGNGSAEPQAGTNNANTAAPKKNNASILMADTDPEYFFKYRDFFVNRGFDIVNACNSKEFVTNLAKVKPQAIFMDTKLEDVRSENLIRIMRKKGFRKPIFIISSKLNRATIESLKDLRVDGFFPKSAAAHQVEAKLKLIFEELEKKKQAKKTGKIWPPLTALIITENSFIIDKAELAIPTDIIKEHKLRVFSRKNFQEAVAVIKKPESNIKLILVDAAKEYKITGMIRLLKIIETKLKIPIFFFSEAFSHKLKQTLDSVGFLNVYTRTSLNTRDLKKRFDNVLGGMKDSKSKQKASRVQNIMSQMKQIKSLPPLPDIYLKIEKLSHDPKATSKDYASILELDPAITARLLRMSNSAFYSFKRKIKSVKDTVTLMGTREILSLVRLACITGNLKTNPEVETAVKGVWEHSAACAIAAKVLYETTDICESEDLADEVFICGIIHDIGKIILWNVFPDYYMPMMLNDTISDFPSIDEEEKFLGASHCDVGRALADHWNLPESLAGVISHHHRPMNKPDSEHVRLIHIANNLARSVMGEYEEHLPPEYDPELLEAAGITLPQIEELQNEVAPKIRENLSTVVKMVTG